LSAAAGVALLIAGRSLIAKTSKVDALGIESSIATRLALLALMLVAVTAAFTLMRRFPPVKVTAEGVFAARGTGFRSRLVRWSEITRVVPSSMYGVRFLTLVTNNPFPEQLRMLMHLDEISKLRDFVATQAGTEHPLKLWLSDQLASNKSLERTRG
jgi:hypothetical protein